MGTIRISVWTEKWLEPNQSPKPKIDDSDINCLTGIGLMWPIFLPFCLGLSVWVLLKNVVRKLYISESESNKTPKQNLETHKDEKI